MTIRTSTAWTALTSLALCLSACNGQLAVVDAIDSQGHAIEAGPAATPDSAPTPESAPKPDVLEEPPFEPRRALNAGCGCASSPALQPLLCDGHEVPLVGNDVIQLTSDGAIVAFNIGVDDGFIVSAEEVAYWDGAETRTVARGMLLGLSASGQRLLVTGADPEFNTLAVDPITGEGQPLRPEMLIGRGSLSASGEWAVGVLSDTAQLARSNTYTGDMEVLAEVHPFVARAYVTPDAALVVGLGFEMLDVGLGKDEAFRWTQAGGLTYGLPGAPAGSLWPEALSDDGTVIAGRAQNGHFRWSESEGFESLVVASNRSDAYLSADGSVVLGSLDPEGVDDSAAFRWTRETGVVELTPGRASVATDMSDDGSVIVANSWEDAQLDGEEPVATYVWDAVNGTRTLVELLADRDVDTRAWKFGHARALSGDGKVLVGIGSCDGVPTLYRAVLSE